ncbi:multiple epidermal growth factor-like domains protein 10 [Mercenaria mercenaria]|uniref:multiple epidermal growth factor-like domains protein 10 n=1 Tax=Mercenaria mercenaria TaxID=6596 RepID=UPI00234F53DD|nr:multiple epidermal growth factor-like domains protein 10 [Mercenaria mercenaria]
MLLANVPISHKQACVAKTENSSESICTTCKKGYFPHRNICFKCIGTCTACNSIRYCTECEPEYYELQCTIKCPKNCLECISDDKCTKCKDGWSGVHKCHCSHNCIREGDPETYCFTNGTCAKGCIRGKFGFGCNVDCPEKDRCLECHQFSGRCRKCVSGFYSVINHCDKKCGNCAPDASNEVTCSIEDGECSGPCIDGFYEKYCNQHCSENCLDPITKLNSCSKSTGECSACKIGFYGLTCSNKCSPNCKSGCNKTTGICDTCIDRYGINCTLICSQNCGTEPVGNSRKAICHRANGECLHCKLGFYGQFCDKPCPENCENYTENKQQCYKADGSCLKCQDGYFGTFCKQKCSKNCGRGENRKKGSCDQNTGRCDHGRMSGWYNNTCQETCNITCKDLLCHINTGECLSGCENGFEGVFCERCKQCNSATVEVLAVLLAAVTAALLASVVGLFCLYRRGKRANKAQNTAIYYNTSGVPRSGATESASPLNAPQQDLAYEALKANVTAGANYSQLEPSDDYHIYTQST